MKWKEDSSELDLLENLRFAGTEHRSWNWAWRWENVQNWRGHPILTHAIMIYLKKLQCNVWFIGCHWRWLGRILLIKKIRRKVQWTEGPRKKMKKKKRQDEGERGRGTLHLCHYILVWGNVMCLTILYSVDFYSPPHFQSHRNEHSKCVPTSKESLWNAACKLGQCCQPLSPNTWFWVSLPVLKQWYPNIQ